MRLRRYILILWLETHLYITRESCGFHVCQATHTNMKLKMVVIIRNSQLVQKLTNEFRVEKTSQSNENYKIFNQKITEEF